MLRFFALFLVLSLSCVSASAATVMTVLVTGANRGIGLEMVKQMKARGLNVIGTARKPDEAQELRATGARVEQLDVTDAASLAALASRLDGFTLSTTLIAI